MLSSILLFRGKKLIELPYTVKGMDVSFSGILSYIEVRLFLWMLHLISSLFLTNCYSSIFLTSWGILILLEILSECLLNSVTVSDTFLCFVLEYGTQITWIRRMYTRGFVLLPSGKGDKLTVRPSNTSNNTKLNSKLVGLEVVLTQWNA